MYLKGFNLLGLRFVSPTSIRSRILKDVAIWNGQRFAPMVSPTSIRSRILKGLMTTSAPSPVNPFHPRRSVRGY